MIAPASTPSVIESRVEKNFPTPSPSSYLDRSDVLQELEDLLLESYEDDWDGYDASRASYHAYQYAASFINALPTWVSNPEVDLLPDGSFMIQWNPKPRKTLCLAIAGNGVLDSALLLGRTHRISTETFTGSVPSNIIASIKDVVGYSQGRWS